VQRLVPRVKVDWFHQSANKQARILSHSATVVHNIRFPRGWAQRWSDMYTHLMGYRRDFNSNRWHDAADVLTGIIEQEAVLRSLPRFVGLGLCKRKGCSEKHPFLLHK
jgi:predicted phage terminase large subunit-like protein